MNSLIDALPPDVAQRIHPGWQKNEAEYWANRDDLLSRYRNQWIAFADGRVIASGTSPVDVLHAAQESGLHPFVACVGREYEPSQMRRVSFPYDLTYIIGAGCKRTLSDRNVFWGEMSSTVSMFCSVVPHRKLC